VRWLSENYKWLFDGVAGAAVIALLAFLARQLFRTKPQPPSPEMAATLTAQGAKVTNSPVASGSGISQTVNSPTVSVNLGHPPSEERQANALLAIHSKLEEGLFYLRRAASSGGRYRGEASDQELLRRASLDLAAASTEYSATKLLLSVPLTHKIDEFFNKAVSVGSILNIAQDPMTPNGERARYWNEAQEIANKEMPLILQAIQTEARAEILGTASR